MSITGEKMKKLKKTISVDEKELFKSGKLKTIDAHYVNENGIVYLIKENGTKERIGSIEWWERAENFKAEQEKHPNQPQKEFKNHLLSCGLCNEHKNSTALLNLVATNRCNLRCWYCFFYAEKSGFVYEPSLEEIKKMFEIAKEINGYMPPLQITGGEPTLRNDLEEIIRVAKKLGSPHIQLNTNSVKIAIDYYNNPEETIEELRKLRSAGLNTIYTSFDGIDEKTNFKNHFELPLALKAYSEAGIKSIVLVPTVYRSEMNGIPDNLSQVNGIVKFAIKHRSFGIKGVNFQPISMVGSTPKNQRDKLRVTQSDIIEELKGVGLDNYEYWYPVSSVQYLADLIAKDENHVRFYNNELCGVATYVFLDENDRVYPITNFIDADEFLKDLEKLNKSLYNKLIFGIELASEALRSMSVKKALARRLKRYIIKDELPDGTKISEILNDVIETGTYSSLGMFHEKAMFIGMMHFMDPYNYDVNRVKRCSIHYATPIGVIPFCTYNVFPHIYRDNIMKFFRVKDVNTFEQLLEDEKKEAIKVLGFRKVIKNDSEYQRFLKDIYDV